MIAYAISIKYMVAAYAVILSVLTIYIISLFVRWRKLKRDLQTLDALDKEK
jgi:hypothetical protein